MSDRTASEALARDFEIRQGMARVFEQAMRDGQTSPLAALEMLARALGLVYRDIASVHRDPAGCPCGWQPRAGDLAALYEALQSGATSGPKARPNLQSMEPVGRA